MTADQGFCRLMNHSQECAADDTAQPRYIDWVSVVSLPKSNAYGLYPDLQMYPTVASPVVPIYNLNGVTDLVLTMETLAKIWSGRITTWDHPDIRATNPNFTRWNIPVNQSITLVGRGEINGVTRVFKEAMAAVDPVFKALVGKSSSPTFIGKLVLQNLAQPVISYVMRNQYTMGYSPMGDALVNHVPMARLNRSGLVVEASSASVQYAVMELGLSFGNNGDDPTHLTSDIYGALNPLAWPIALYSYIAVRKATLRPGAACATVAAMVDFWLWFWSSQDVASIASSLGFSVLPQVVNDHVVARFKQDMQCGGGLVWQAPEVPVIQGYGPSMAIPIFDTFRQVYALVNSSVALNYTALISEQADPAPLLEAGGFVVSTAPLAAADAVSLILGSEVLVVVSQFALTLDGLTLAKILNGDIQTWLDPAIVALNPTGIVDGSGRALNDTAQRIVLLQGPTTSSASLTALLQRYYPAYTGAAIQAAEACVDEVQLRSSVIGTPYSFSVSALVGQLPQELQPAAIVSASGAAVTPSASTAQSCLAGAAYDAARRSVSLSTANSSCYPLLLTLYVNVQRRCPISSSSMLDFVDWMFSAKAQSGALEALNLVSFSGVSGAIQQANDEALFQLSCAVRVPPTNIVPLLLAVIIPIAVVLLLGAAGCGWWLWRVTEYNRMLRKKFSNDNVAESCAEAIARFDLDAVAWLREVQEPNKIQLAFLAIIALLTEVKPYIPDQLLSQLTAAAVRVDAEEDDPATEQQSELSLSLAHGNGNDRLSPAASGKWLRSQRSPSIAQSANFSPRKGHNAATARGSVTWSDGSNKVLAMKDWHRKRCTYLCIRFGSTYPNAEKRLPELVRVAGRIVDVAKAHGATIDAVGVNFVTVHWGATTASCSLAVKAVHAGLEMARLRETLPEDQQATFWLQAGVGKGVCDCGTVSSESGHRFFVVWGPEPSLALDIAMGGIPKRVLACLLVSPAVYQEVQYSVRCMPRLWHGDALLWEPVCAMGKEDDDEWMYELQKMDNSMSASHKTILDVFLMAKGEAVSPADVAAHIAQLRAQCGGRLSAQDTASLDLLASRLAAPDSLPLWDIVAEDDPN
eukprot:EG_transcript_509